MALEAVVFQNDPFVENAFKDYNYNNMGWYDDFAGSFQPFQEDQKPCVTENLEITNNGDQTSSYNTSGWNSISPLVAHHNTTTTTTTSSSSPENILSGGGDNVFFSASSRDHQSSLLAAPNMSTRIRKRRRERTLKNKADMENQRMTHIAVERNRRRQMNDYLAVLRSLMPPSYSQRGDQASIVGGAINFVKELEQLLQYLESRNKPANVLRQPLSNFFTFPQYTTESPTTTITDQSSDSSNTVNLDVNSMMERRSGVADIEVNMVDTHSNIKVLVKKRGPKQLLKMVTGLQSLGFTVLHLNITTVDQSVLYSFSVKVEDECQFSTVNEIATAVHEIVEMIQHETKTTTSSSIMSV